MKESSKIVQPVNNNQKELSPKGALVSGGFIIFVGILAALVGLKIIPADPSKIYAPTWVIVSIGLIFIFSGSAVINGFIFSKKYSKARLIQDLLGMLLIGLMAAVFAWIAVNPDKLQSTIGESASLLPGMPIGTGLGRFVFGFASIIFLIFFIYFTKSFIQRLNRLE